jgi:hypothetical protein
VSLSYCHRGVNLSIRVKVHYAQVIDQRVQSKERNGSRTTTRCMVCLIVCADVIMNKWLPVRRICEKIINKFCTEIIRFLPERKPVPRKTKKKQTTMNKLLVSLPEHAYLCY